MASPTPIGQLAAAIQGELHGNADLVINKLVHPKMIASGDELAVILAPEAIQLLQMKAKAQPGSVKAAVLPKGCPVPEGLLESYIEVEHPRMALGMLLHYFSEPPYHTPSVHPTAIVDPSAEIHDSVSVGAFVTIGPNVKVGANGVILPHVSIGANVHIGSDVLLYDGVRLGDNTVMGDRVSIHYNTAIGADGFSYFTPGQGSIESARQSGGKIESVNTEHIKIPSIGNVIIEDDVEIGACTTIDRSNLGPTLIKKGTKIDNLVMIAHNNTVGEHCLVVSQVGIAGSCTIGDRVVLAGQVGLKDHLKIGNDSIIMAKAGLMADVPEKSIYAGAPAKPQREFFQETALIGKLSGLRRDMMRMKKQIDALEQELASAKSSEQETATV